MAVATDSPFKFPWLWCNCVFCVRQSWNMHVVSVRGEICGEYKWCRQNYASAHCRDALWHHIHFASGTKVRGKLVSWPENVSLWMDRSDIISFHSPAHTVVHLYSTLTHHHHMTGPHPHLQIQCWESNAENPKINHDMYMPLSLLALLTFDRVKKMFHFGVKCALLNSVH